MGNAKAKTAWIATTAVIFLVDILTARGITIWIFYMVVLIWAAASLSVKAIYLLAVLYSALIAIGVSFSPPSIDPTLAGLHSAFEMAGLWLTALLLAQRRKAEDRRSASESRLRRLVESNIIGIFDADRFGKVTNANDAFLSMVGYTRKDLREGRIRWTEMTPPEYRSLDEWGIAESEEKGACTPYEKEYVRKDGTRVPVFIGYAFWSGSKTEYICFLLDLTPLRKAEQELRESREQLQLVMETTPVSIFYLDRFGRYVYANPTYLTWVGAEKETAVKGKGVREVIGEKAYEAFRPHLETAYSGNKVDTEYLRPSYGEAPRFIHLSMVPNVDQDGSITGIVAAMVDITDRKKEEERVREYSRRLQTAYEELQLISYSIAHDLRTPLRGISNFGQLFLRKYGGELTDEGKHYLERITGNASQMWGLIDGLLNLTHIIRYQMKVAPVDLTRIAKNVARELISAEPERGVALSIEEGVIGKGDPYLLRVVMENLLQNAWKFTRGRDVAVIEFSVKQRDGVKTYCVRDNGVGFGFGSEHAGKLFGAFQRLHVDFSGPGIGLAIVKKIIQRHGGTVWAEGEEGKGAAFCFTLEDEERLQPLAPFKGEEP